MSGSPTKKIARPQNLAEYKIQAAILHKSLNADELSKALEAATRFQRLAQFSHLSSSQLLLQKESIKLKHALAVIAQENNYPSWPDFKRVLEKREALKQNRSYNSLYPRRCGGFTNEWYANYQTARDHREQTGGYLLPYRNQFFICTSEYIRVLGLDPNDADWQLINFDWIEPADRDAWQRLNEKLQQVERELAE